MPAPSKNRSDFMRRLSYYLMGLAIGFMMLGLMWQAKQRRAAQQTQAQQVQGEQVQSPQGAAPAAPDPGTVPTASDETDAPAPASNTGP